MMAALALLAVASACRNGEWDLETRQDNRVPVKFSDTTWGVSAVTRVTDDVFDDGDMLSISVVKNDTSAFGDVLQKSGNYADNFCYRSNGTFFISQGDTIWQHHSVPLDLIYYALYPYRATLDTTFTFTAMSDQSTAANYAASDLCMQKLATRKDSVVLQLKHKMSCIEVDLKGYQLDQIAGGLGVALLKRYTQVQAYQNGQRVATIETLLPTAQTLKMYNCYSSSTVYKYRAMVAPQTIEEGDNLLTISIGGMPSTIPCPNTLTIKSGQRLRLEYEVEVADNVVAITYGGEEIEENPVDSRIDVRPRKR